MASGVPVIASKIGFLPQLIEDGLNGCLMDLSPENLANILSGLMKNRKKLDTLARRAFETAEQRFSMALQAERTLSLYRRLLDRRGQ